MKNTVWHRKWICLLLVAAIAVSGMYFEKVRIDSSFDDGKCTTGSVLSSKVSVITGQEELCTGEVMGLKSTGETYTQRARSGKENRFSRLIVVFSILALSLEKSLRKSETADGGCDAGIRSTWYQIICFMHRQDGAKG